MAASNKIQVGYIEAQDGAQFEIDAGTAAAPGLVFDDSAATGLYSPGTGQLAWSTSGKQTALRILADGKVGVDCSPTVAFEVNGTIKASAIDAPIEGTLDDWIVHAGDSNTKFGFPAVDAFAVETNGTEKLRIISNGKMGLGTNNPTQYFHVVGNSASVQTEESGGGIVRMQSGGSVGYVGTYSNHPLLLQVNSQEKLRITSTGVVSINDSTPETWAALQVKNHTASNAAQVVIHGADMAQIILRDETGGTNTKCTTFRNDEGTLKIGTHNDAWGGFSEKLSITPDGDVCINQSGVVDNAKLTIKCDATQPAIAIQANHTNTDTKLISAWNSSGKNIVNITAESDNSPYLKFQLWSTTTNSALERFRVNHLGNVAIGGGTAASNRVEIINDHKGMVGDSAQPNATFLIKHGTGGTDRRWIGIGASTSMAWLQSSSPGGSGLAAPFEINPGGGDVTLGNDKLKVAHSGGIVWIGSFTQYGNNVFDASNGSIVVTSSGQNTLKLIDSTAQAANVGARILLGGNYRSSGDASPFVELKSFKTNSTDNNYDYGFKISTTPNGGSLSERLHITAGGQVNIGGDYTQTAYKAQITGDLLLQKSQAAYQHPQLELYATSNTAHGGAIKFSGKHGGSKYEQVVLKAYGGTGANTGSFVIATGNGSDKLRIHADGMFEFKNQTLANLSVDHYNGTSNSGLKITIDGTEHFRFEPGFLEFKEASNTSKGTLLGGIVYFSNTNLYVDLTQWTLATNWNVLEVFGYVNPNSSGSGQYTDPLHMYIYRGVGWNTAIKNYIYSVHVAPPARQAFPGGSGMSGNSGVSAVWYHPSSGIVGNESATSTHYIRLVIPNANASNNFQKTFRILRRF